MRRSNKTNSRIGSGGVRSDSSPLEAVDGEASGGKDVNGAVVGSWGRV